MGEIPRLIVSVAGECPTYPTSDMSELYTLRVMYGDRSDAYLYGEQVWGVLRGLETFSQLVDHVDGTFIVNSSFIIDYPRFNFRGVMLDTSRHYLPVKYLLENLDAMEANKFNVFHWHIVDDQSFPYVSRNFPELSEKGAFRETHVYTQEDVKTVIDYARKRGIRVISEFDTPGHTLSWGKAIKNLLTPCDDIFKPPEERFGPIDPTKSSTYDFLRQFFAEVANVFPDDFVHLGGDEVDFSCWRSNENISSFMEEHNITGDYPALESFYMQKLVDIIEDLGKQYIVWQEVFDNGVQLKRESIINVWKDDQSVPYEVEMDKITRSGHRAILSAPWYEH